MSALALPVIPSRQARVRHDLAEVVEELHSRPAPAQLEVSDLQRRPVLCVAAEVVRTAQVVGERPHAAAVTLLLLDSVLECAEERVEGRRRALVGGREQLAPDAGTPALPALDSWQVGLEGHACVVDAVTWP